MGVNFINIDSGRVLRHSQALKGWIKGAVEAENYTLSELSIAFCSDSYIEEQNIKYLGHNYATDILTFGYNEQRVVSGDLLISTDTVKSNAERYAVSYQNELHRVIIHGVLHLVGYDDTSEAKAKKMRERENHYLSLIEL